MKNIYNLKSGFELKDIDTGSRQVAMYLSKFDTMDSDNDIIKKGAFKKSIKERGVKSTSNRKIAFLRHHDWEKQIGKFVELAEDDYGLYAVGQLGRSTDGEDALKDYEDGIIKEHSIGFQYIPDKMKFVKDDSINGGGYNEIKELILWEGSAVTFGSNQYTYVIGMKGQEKNDHIDRITNELNLCIRAITNGKGTDERLHELEMKIKYLNSQLILLATDNPVNDQLVETKSKEVIKTFDWNLVMNNYSQKQTFADYPEQAKKNAKRGIELNEAVNNRCATSVGKQRGQDISQGRGLSLDTLKRTYSFLSRAKTYYNPNDEKACGTISYLLWGGNAMLTYCERKLSQLDE